MEHAVILGTMIDASNQEIEAGQDGWLYWPEDHHDEIEWLIDNAFVESNGEMIRPTKEGRDAITFHRQQ